MKLNDSQRLQKQVEGSASSGATLMLQSGCVFPYSSVKTKVVIPNDLLFGKCYIQAGNCFSDLSFNFHVTWK